MGIPKIIYISTQKDTRNTEYLFVTGMSTKLNITLTKVCLFSIYSQRVKNRYVCDKVYTV